MNTFLPFIISGLVTGSIYSLAAVGLVLTYRTSGIFNFAHGTVAAIGAYAFFQARDLWGLPSPVAFVLAVLVAGPLVGLLLELLGRRLGNASVVTRVVAMLGVLIAVQQIAIIRYGAQTQQFAPFLPTDRLKVLGVFVEVGQLIVMLIALVGTVGLFFLLRLTRLGLGMRGVVDNTELLALTGTSPPAIRRIAWMIGCVFASLSGVLIAPSIGLDASILTLLVVQTFGAAAIGRFTSLPLTYVGGLVIGVGAALATKYVGDVTFVNLNGLPTSLPFLVLFAVLLFSSKGKLIDIAPDKRPLVRSRAALGLPARLAVAAVGVTALALVPGFVGSRILVFSLMLPTALIFLSLALLDRLSGQLSLAQLAFAAIGATTFAKVVGAGAPFFVGLLAAALVAMPVGALLAIPAIRLSGLYLALATLGFSLVMEALIYGTSLMFGVGKGFTSAPRPSFAKGDNSYYYLLLVIVVAVSFGVSGVRRSRLGRLLRAMSDSPTALATHGMNVTTIKVMAFCLSAAIAGLAGALIGPVTGQATATNFSTFGSLLLVVVLALQGPLSDVPASFAAAIAIVVVPSYLADSSFNEYLPVLFGVSAIVVAIVRGSVGARRAGSVVETADGDEQADRDVRNPRRARFAELQKVST